MDNSFWAFVALLIFLGILVYLKVPATITKALDAGGPTRSGQTSTKPSGCAMKPRHCLMNTRRSVKPPKRKRRTLSPRCQPRSGNDCCRSAGQIGRLCPPPDCPAEQKIGQAEAEAVNAVRGSAVDVAIAASQKILSGRGAKDNADLFKQALADVKARLN